jgi:hypothetical protein
MNCQRCRIEIEELETSERLSDEARTHLSVCALCRAFHDERQSLKRLIGGLGTVNAPPDFDFRLRARISAAKASGNRHSSWRSFLASAPAIGLAASFALLVTGVIFYNQTRIKTSTNESAVVAPANSPQQKPAQASVNPVPAVSVPENALPGSEISKKDDAASVATAAKNPRSRVNGSNKTTARHESSQQGANDSLIISNDTAVRSAQQIVPNGAAPFSAGTNPIIELPVRSASQPMRIFVDDKSGAKRTLTLEPVVFGSQDLMGRNPTTTSSAATSQGIW